MATISGPSVAQLARALRNYDDAANIAETVADSLEPAADVAALTDSSGGATADGTIGAVTAPTAITDNTTGTTTATFAAGVGVYDLNFHCSLVSTGAVDLVTAIVPGHKFKILSWEFTTDVPGVGSGASRVANLEIGTTDVGTTPSTLTLTEAGTSLAGERTAATAVAGANTGTASDTLSIEIAAGGTDFSAGTGTFVIKIQNMDTADAIAGICTAQAANRTAIIALTDAIKELATKQNLSRTNLRAAGLML